MDVITTIDYLRYSYYFVEVTWQEARFDAGLVVYLERLKAERQ